MPQYKRSSINAADKDPAAIASASGEATSVFQSAAFSGVIADLSINSSFLAVVEETAAPTTSQQHCKRSPKPSSSSLQWEHYPSPSPSPSHRPNNCRSSFGSLKWQRSRTRSSVIAIAVSSVPASEADSSSGNIVSIPFAAEAPGGSLQ